MDTRQLNTAAAFKTVIAVCGSVASLIAGVLVGARARHCQVVGEPMSDGKGGSMSVGNGYIIAAVLFLFCVACLLQARRFWRGKQL
jgi:hypothetical protein